MNTIYEASKTTIISVPFLLVCLLTILVGIYSAINWKHNVWTGRIGMLLIVVILLVIVFATIVGHIKTLSLYQKYSSGECVVIEGCIDNYEASVEEALSYPDRFTVCDIPFVVSRTPYTGYGYCLRQIDGGELKQGQYCRIHYIPYGEENVIMRLEVQLCYSSETYQE